MPEVEDTVLNQSEMDCVSLPLAVFEEPFSEETLVKESPCSPDRDCHPTGLNITLLFMYILVNFIRSFISQPI